MTFQEKLQFLMKITQTSNKELAANISVDPSLISLLRTGRRKESFRGAQARFRACGTVSQARKTGPVDGRLRPLRDNIQASDRCNAGQLRGQNSGGHA